MSVWIYLLSWITKSFKNVKSKLHSIAFASWYIITKIWFSVNLNVSL